MNSKLFEVMSFSARAHKNQIRKVDDSPYVNHLLEVTAILNFAGIHDDAILSAAMLHDVIEDTDSSFDQLAFLFGSDIACIVEMLSDDKSVNAIHRKQNIKDRLELGRFDYTAIKLADLISNISAIPKTWDEIKIEQYLTQCGEILDAVSVPKDSTLRFLLDLANYVLEVQTVGSAIYSKLCELAQLEQLYWSAQFNAIMVIDSSSNHDLTGYCIEGEINIMFQLGLLRGLKLDIEPPINVIVQHSVDENFNDVSFEHHQKMTSAMKLVSAHSSRQS